MGGINSDNRPTVEKASPTGLSRLAVEWQWIKSRNDFVLRSHFREAMGNPAQETFRRWLANPGKIESSILVQVCEFLKKHGRNVSVNNLIEHI